MLVPDRLVWLDCVKDQRDIHMHLEKRMFWKVTTLSPPSVRWLDGWCGAGYNLGAGLLYQAEYRSKLKLSGSTKSDVVSLPLAPLYPIFYTYSCLTHGINFCPLSPPFILAVLWPSLAVYRLGLVVSCFITKYLTCYVANWTVLTDVNTKKALPLLCK